MSGPITLADFERIAYERMAPMARDYYLAGADDEITLAENLKAFDRWRLRPRFLRNVTNINTKTSLLGHVVPSPVCIAPTAMQRMAHPDGEIAVSRANRSVMVLSTYATATIEDVIAEANPETAYWFQLYVHKKHDVSEELIRRAEAAGYKALVLTIDTPYIGRRLVDVRNKFQLPPHLHLSNFDPSLIGDSPAVQDNKIRESRQPTTTDIIDRTVDAAFVWENLQWLKSITKMKIILKGIMTAEDTELAVKWGVDAIIVSNHGGRQLDGVFATIDVLPEIVQASCGRLEIYMDGGIRRGTDIFKALALGAKAVFIGRPILYGLAYNGEDGVKKVLQILQEEFILAMALAGCTKIEEITPAYVRHISQVVEPKL